MASRLGTRSPLVGSSGFCFECFGSRSFWRCLLVWRGFSAKTSGFSSRFQVVNSSSDWFAISCSRERCRWDYSCWSKFLSFLEAMLFPFDLGRNCWSYWGAYWCRFRLPRYLPLRWYLDFRYSTHLPVASGSFIIGRSAAGSKSAH